MKTILLLILFLVLSGTNFAQCPTAGRDSAVTYCKNEPFDVADLRSSDADLGGAFIDPWGDTMTITVDTLIFPGQYTYRYIVSDLGCSNDSAKYVITIISWCEGGLSEITENNTLIQSNPVSQQLILTDPHYDQLEIYETSGRRILLSNSQSILDVSHLQRGNYILVLEKNGTKRFQRFIKY